jgi:hypothetical protein
VNTERKPEGGGENRTCLEYIPTSDYARNPVTNFTEALLSEYSLNEFEIHKTGPMRHCMFFFHHSIFCWKELALLNEPAIFKLRHIKYLQLILKEFNY